MNRLTLIPSDGAVYFDDKVILGLDLSFIPNGVHALQWLNDAGWIEYIDPAIPNEPISVLPNWAIDAYNLAIANYIPPNQGL